ncbi:hypothetical protein AWB76_00060 [Caballeronia temeraria]|uniref:Uncharacterized protein n=1 Tax=Caballeronia temeraria TaxID=1777137 RepID=A0A157Z1P9_9BURK|nr:hypothetical protein [Caballeronia temeraria]SAK39392.1 hypothetical protein AWB76_00060 [Caballeronia temeraria]
MNRPDHSLSLDSVICKRCNTVSPAEEETCPSCGADRQGAIFTSRAAEAAVAAAAPVPAPLDILDWDDSHWLQRLVRRRMLTSYPNYIEPGDSQEPAKPARTGMAVLVGGVIASIAVGGYFYARLDDNAPAPSVEPGISVAGSIRDGASGVPKADATRHASLTRSKAEAATAQIVAPAPPAIAAAKPNRTHEEHAATEVAPVAPHVAAASTIVSSSTLAATAPAKPSMPAAPVAATARVAPNPPSADIATPSALAATKPATTTPATIAAAPSIKPVTPVIASAQKPEPRVNTTIAAAAPAPAKPVTQAPAPVARSIEQARNTTIAASSKPPAPAPRPSEQPRNTATIASIDKPAAPAPEPLPPAVARSIASVQQALASRDLASARRHMRGLSASEPRSPEIQQLAAELSRQERARDSAMATARTCTANLEPACALRNARRAVALDPRNGQTQATLRHALEVQNETNTEYFRQASGIPKPVVPTMSYDGRWSAGTRHPAMSGDQDDGRFSLFGLGVPVVSKGRGDAH